MSDELRQTLCEIEQEIHRLEQRIAKLRADMVPPTVRAIIDAVGDYYNVPPIHLLSQRRPQALSLIRHVAMYLAMELTAKSYPVIGRAFGERDHTTIMHGVRKITSLLLTDPELGQQVEAIKASLKYALPSFRVAA